MCYNNISTYKSPPVGTGGLEPPRQLTANSFQSYRACLLHHVPISENRGTAPAKLLVPPNPLINNNIPNVGYKSSAICGNNDIDGIINSGIKETDMARLVRMCPSCRSRRLKKYDIYRYGRTSRTRYRCESCGKLTIYPLMKLVAERKKK